jgi:hypothetical protein
MPQVKLHRIIVKLICHFMSQMILYLGPFYSVVTLDAATATQVIYSASSVAERIVGPFLVAEKIYSVW